MTKKLTRPVERCPFCGEKFLCTDVTKMWCCFGNDHTFHGPFSDQYGRGIDRVVRQMRARILKEANND